MEQIKIFDATLYGGGQSPGASLNIEEKLEIARLLEQMGVDVIQAGPSPHRVNSRQCKDSPARCGRV
jgi:isopropylmalate/homocitrate/citramalate synthase